MRDLLWSNLEAGHLINLVTTAGVTCTRLRARETENGELGLSAGSTELGIYFVWLHETA